jgi:hypothetical protein
MLTLHSATGGVSSFFEDIPKRIVHYHTIEKHTPSPWIWIHDCIRVICIQPDCGSYSVTYANMYWSADNRTWHNFVRLETEWVNEWVVHSRKNGRIVYLRQKFLSALFKKCQIFYNSGFSSPGFMRFYCICYYSLTYIFHNDTLIFIDYAFCLTCSPASCALC